MFEDFFNFIRRQVAPPRFMLFAAILIALLVLAMLSGFSFQIAFLTSFDIATTLFLLSLLPILNDDAVSMRATSAANDANRVGLLGVTVLIVLLILVAVGTLVSQRNGPPEEVPLILASLVLAWVFANQCFRASLRPLVLPPSERT